MINDIKNAIQKATKSFGMTKANVNNKKKDSINSNNVIKNLSTSPDAKPWYKKKASIIAMSSALGVGVLAIAIAVPVALTSQKSNDTNTLPPITVTEILSPIQLLSISFNEAEIRKNNINNITIEILKANIIVPTAMVPLELTISGLVKNVDLNFCTFHLGTVSEVYIVKTIYWDVTYSNVQPNLLYDKILNAWNKHTGPTSKWNILYDVFVGKNKLYQEAFYCDSLLYSLTNDLLLNNEVYNYFKDKKQSTDIVEIWASGASLNLGQMSETNRGTEFFTLDAMFQINNSSSMFITKLTYRTAYNFTQQFSLREFTNIKKYYEITFPIGSITTVTDKSQDLSTPSPQGNWIPFRTSKNSKEITFRIDPSLLGITT